MYIVIIMKRIKRKRIPMLVEISPELNHQLIEYAKAHGMQAKASIVRYALQLFLQEHAS